jgi:hypothetical protein
MGEIVAFPIPQKKRRRRRASMAKILFFTGVRYLRPHELGVLLADKSTGGDAPDRSSPSRRRKRRA